MKIRIKRIDPSLPLPRYQTRGAAGFDLIARETCTVPPRKIGYIPLNVCVGTPPGYFLLLAARGSLHKRGLMMANGVGVGDSDFCGNDDEYKAPLYNFTGTPVIVERGERIVQGKFIPIEKCEWEEVNDMEAPNRGGFGSTGLA